MANSTASNRKTGRMITKNLIVLLVLAVVAVITMWAWFTKMEKITASNMSVECIAPGIEISWDGENYYEQLTSRGSFNVNSPIGPAMSFYDDNRTPASLKLISGNGEKFFDPFINRSQGSVLVRDGYWQGSEVKNSTGKYIDIPLYFRFTSERKVYLAKDSKVSPTSQLNRSPYGDFSRDYICAATRVAFLDSKKESCNFIWAPNADVELKSNNAGYTKMSGVKSDEVQDDTVNIPDSMLYSSDGKSYNLWFPEDYSSDMSSQSSGMKAHKMTFTSFKSNGTGMFTCELEIDSSVISDSPKLPFIINSSSTLSAGDENNTNYSYSQSNNDSNAAIEISDTEFNVQFPNNYTARATAFYIKPNIVNSHNLKITIGYQPENKKVIILGYSNELGVSYELTGGASIRTERYYEIENANSNAALVNPGYSLAVSADSVNNYQTQIRFSSTTKDNVEQSALTDKEVFNIIKTGEGYEAKYVIKYGLNQYLKISETGEATFAGSSTKFSLGIIDGFSGPVLVTNDSRYLVFDNRVLKVVPIGSVRVEELVTVYLGDAYKLVLGQDAVPEEGYYYYSKDAGRVLELNENTTPPLFATPTEGSSKEMVGDKMLVQLEKDASSDYYKAQIYIRIWVEGTDREAQAPFADGLFNASLHFVAKS